MERIDGIGIGRDRHRREADIVADLIRRAACLHGGPHRVGVAGNRCADARMERRDRRIGLGPPDSA